MRTTPGVPREESRFGKTLDHVTPFAERRYSVELWDYDPAEDGSRPGEWSGFLARKILDGPNEGLTWREIGRAIKALLRASWSYETMYVQREDA